MLQHANRTDVRRRTLFCSLAGAAGVALLAACGGAAGVATNAASAATGSPASSRADTAQSTSAATSATAAATAPVAAAGAAQARGAPGSGPGGMMGGYGPGTGGMGGMLPGWGRGLATGQVISLDQAQQALQQYLDQFGTPDLALDEMLEFQDNVYAIVKERSSGIGAVELLVNTYTGGVIPEPGPNMLWNTKYGMLGAGPPAAAMTVSADQATQIAQRWLDQQQPGSSTETPDRFYGYYTLHLRKDGKVSGMLSVNGATGQVWYHTWHGPFVRMKELGH